MSSRHYYPALDGLRALAIALVFCFHYEIPLMGAQKMGWIGVDIFFVLSGFLITGILFDSREEPHRVRDFYMRRVLRIFPLYYGVWIAIALSWPIFRWKIDARFLLYPLHLGNYITFVFFDRLHPGFFEIIQNGGRHIHFVPKTLLVGHFWSLCVEEQFYLLWPAIVFSRLSQRGLLRTCCIGSFAVLLLRVILFHHAPEGWLEQDFIYRFTWTRIDSFLIGGALALALRGPQKEWLSRHWRAVVWPAHVLFLAFYLRCLAMPLAPGQMEQSALIAMPGYTLVALWTAALILHAIEEETVAFRIFSLRTLRKFGGISYGFYVYHYMLIVPFRAAGYAISLRWHTYTTAAVGFVMTLLVSTLSYNLYESKFLKLKTRFAHQVHRAPAA